MNRKMRLTACLIFVIVISVIVGNACISYCQEMEIYNKQIADLDEQIEAQREYSRELDAAGDEYMSEENVIRIAREVLSLVKSGEKFFKNYSDNQ